MGAPWDSNGWDGDHDWQFTGAPEDSPEQLYALWDAAVARSRARLAAAGGPRRPRPARALFWSSPTAPPERAAPPLHDMIEEYGRDTGHMDLIREAIDGRVGEDPPADWRP